MSNILKPSSYIPLEKAKLIHVQHVYQPITPEPTNDEPVMDPTEHPDVKAAQELSEKIKQDAEYHAEQLIQQAQEHISQMKKQAEQEIDEWWTEKRNQDKQVYEQSQQEGFEQGYQAGYEEAEQRVHQQYADLITEAQSIIEQAHRVKEQIIHEAEPFLLDLSLAIAEKIIDQQLTVDKEWVVSHIKKLLAQRQVAGSITLSVSPSQFDYIVSARQELLLVLDPQIELHIHPDPNIKDQGCILRSSFGSMDATIGTQLQEIKKALRQISVSKEEILHVV